MPNEAFVPAETFCIHHNIQLEFIESLQAYGLIEVSIIEQCPSIAVEQLPALEKMVRLHEDLDINTEGIETIWYMLERMEEMRREMNNLRGRLSRYE
jgi:chaperone modulatory protein CbpM